MYRKLGEKLEGEERPYSFAALSIQLLRRSSHTIPESHSITPISECLIASRKDAKYISNDKYIYDVKLYRIYISVRPIVVWMSLLEGYMKGIQLYFIVFSTWVLGKFIWLRSWYKKDPVMYKIWFHKINAHNCILVEVPFRKKRMIIFWSFQ